MPEMPFPMQGALTYWRCGDSLRRQYAFAWLQKNGIEECMPSHRSLNDVLGAALRRVFDPATHHVDRRRNEKEGYTVVAITAESTPEGLRNQYLNEQTVVPDHRTGYCSALGQPLVYGRYIEVAMDDEKELLRPPQIEELINNVANHLEAAPMDDFPMARFIPRKSLDVWRDFAGYMQRYRTNIYIATTGKSPEEAAVFIHSLVDASREMAEDIERRLNRLDRGRNETLRKINAGVDLLNRIESYLNAMKCSIQALEEIAERSRDLLVKKKIEAISSEFE